MSEEVFDVVNDQDEVIGQAPRSQVHQRGWKHRAVHVLVTNARGQLFLQKRSLKKDCFPGVWDSSASGHLDQGEDYDACALREVWEELGVRLTRVPDRLFKVEACPETGQEFVWASHCVYEGPFTLHPDEIETGGWFSPEEINQWMANKPAEFASGLVLIWQRWREGRNHA